MIILIYRMDIFKYLNQFSKYLSTYLSIMDQSTIFLFVLFSSPTDQQKMRGNFCLCHPVYKELPRLRGQQAWIPFKEMLLRKLYCQSKYEFLLIKIP